MTIDLTPEERALLVRVLERAEKELVHEIDRTDHRSLRDALRRDADVLAQVLGKARRAAAAA